MKAAPRPGYDNLFYARSRRWVQDSAPPCLDVLLAHLSVASVLDVGCGLGLWLSAWQDRGVGDLMGVDDPTIDMNRLAISPALFRRQDLKQSFDLGRTFDLVQCLEVAEHLEAAHSPTLVASLVRHGKLVFFSAAPPGQGGLGHVNERPYEYWRDLFLAHDYHLFDMIRPALQARPEVKSWYRHNVLLYAHSSLIPTLPPAVLATRVDDSAPIRSRAGVFHRLKRKVVRRVSPELQSRLVQLKARLLFGGMT